jgi:transferase CAF17, mitochondrial
VNVACSFPIFRYWLRSKVEIDNVSEDSACWQRFRQDVVHTDPEARLIGWGQVTDHAAELAAQGTSHGWQ